MTTQLPRMTTPVVAAALMFAVAFAAGAASRSAEKPKPAARLAHMVFFGLKDRSPEARDKFVAVCRELLSGHEGSEFFEVGMIAEDVVEPVSVRDFDIALHVVFASKEAEAKYLKSPRHTRFVDENKALFSNVRVFDSYLAANP